MRIRSLVSVITAIVVVAGAPFTRMPAGDPDRHGGLVCYCCAAMEEGCSMISCSGCGCGSRTGPAVDRWSPEMVLNAFHLISPSGFIFLEAGCLRAPSSVCLEIPTQPPNRIV